MVNKYHALIFRKKKGKTIIGVLVRVRFFFFSFKKKWKFAKMVFKKKKKIKQLLDNGQ